MPKNILDKRQISQILNRLAYEIEEKNFEMDRLVLAGISPRGSILANLIKLELSRTAPERKVELLEVVIDKNSPNTQPAVVNPDFEISDGDSVIVIDDVLYTGKTLIYALLPFLKAGVEKLQTLVLVQRDYLKFPVKADFVGISMATTYKEHVEVILDDEMNVFIS